MFRNKNIQNVRLLDGSVSLLGTRAKRFFTLFVVVTLLCLLALVAGILAIQNIKGFTHINDVWAGILITISIFGTPVAFLMSCLCFYLSILDIKVSPKKQRRLLFKLEKYEYKYTSKAHKNQTTHSNKVLKKDYKAKYKINKK